MNASPSIDVFAPAKLNLFLAVTANVGGGGLWSKEAVPLAAVATAIDTWLSAQPASDSGAPPADAPNRTKGVRVI